LRSKGKSFRNEFDDAISPSPSSTTVDDESQSLRQSSGDTGGVLGCRRGGATAGGGFGPLNDSTVLDKLLEVGLWGIIWWCGGYNRFSIN
jgi:hypothetical protein